MKEIIIVVLNDMLSDSRIKKHIGYLSRRYRISVICLFTGAFEKNEYHRQFPKIRFYFIPYNGCTYKKTLLTYIEWQFILRIKTYSVLRKLNGLILANDFEALLPAFLARIHDTKSVIYDTHEIWTERQGCQRTIMHKMINAIERVLEIHIVKRIRSIITISDEIAHYLQNQWQYNKSIHIVRNIPQCIYPLRRILNRQTLGIAENKILFVYTGTISRERNSDKLIDVFSRYFPQCNLLLVGKSNISIPVENNIFHMSAVPESELIDIISIADIGIHPLNTSSCINHQYALPNKVFQYMSAGLALCFYENQSISDIIDKYNNGVYGNMNTVQSIKQNIELLLKRDIENMKKQSLIAAENEFNWENEMHKLDFAI